MIRRRVDLTIAVDSSFSLPFAHFGRVKRFLNRLLQHLDLTDSADRFQVRSTSIPNRLPKKRLVQVGLLAFGGRRVSFSFAPLWRSIGFQAGDYAVIVDQLLYFGGRANLSNGFQQIAIEQQHDEQCKYQIKKLKCQCFFFI